MKSSDITLSIFIVILFILLLLVNVVAIGIKNIENNWPTYRCNPVVMPFASVFGQDAVSNFTYCIQNMQSSYMSFLLEPINYNLANVGDIGDMITNALNSARAFINNLRNMITSIVSNIFGVFLNILVAFQRVLVDLKDIAGKMVGTITALMQTMTGFSMFGQAIWNGPPGDMVRTLGGICFHPDTKLQLENGEIVTMKDIPLNSRLKNGAVVTARMALSNVKDNGEYNEELYEVPGEDGENTLVTGSHLVFNKKEQRFMYVSEIVKLDTNFKKSDKQSKELACLITSDHTIIIGNYLFHDWEDNNGSPSKTVIN